MVLVYVGDEVGMNVVVRGWGERGEKIGVNVVEKLGWADTRGRELAEHKNIAPEGDILVSNLGLVSTAVSTCTTKFVDEGDVTVTGAFDDFLTITLCVFIDVDDVVEGLCVVGWVHACTTDGTFE